MSSHKKILVTGASGLLGRLVVSELEQAGQTAIRAVRKPPANAAGMASWLKLDLKTGDGLEDCVSGIATIIHCASSTGPFDPEVDVSGTKALLAAARSAGVSHMIHVSIVGIDRVPYQYYKIKLQAEEVVRASGIPFTILRATQFHEFAEFLLARLTRLPLVFLPGGIKIQPVETRAVAKRLVEIAGAEPTNGIREIGGPDVWELRALVKTWLGAHQKRRLLLPMPGLVLGRLARPLRSGGLTTSVQSELSLNWEEHLSGSAAG